MAVARNEQDEDPVDFARESSTPPAGMSSFEALTREASAVIAPALERLRDTGPLSLHIDKLTASGEWQPVQTDGDSITSIRLIDKSECAGLLIEKSVPFYPADDFIGFYAALKLRRKVIACRAVLYNTRSMETYPEALPRITVELPDQDGVEVTIRLDSISLHGLLDTPVTYNMTDPVSLELLRHDEDNQRHFLAGWQILADALRPVL